MYWVVLSLFTLAESWTWFILSWLPFYSLFRLALLAYLVLPQTQGARLLYTSYVHPFLAVHEAEIDDMISRGHDRAKAAGLQYLKKAIEYIKQNLLGIQPKAQSFPPKEGGSYAQSLLSRFYVPSARATTVPMMNTGQDIYGLLGAAVGQMSRTSEVADISSSGTLIPRDIEGNEEKMTFLATQREKLRVLLSALDKEAWELGSQEGMANEEAIRKDVERRLGGNLGGGEGLRQRGSESEFDTIDREEAPGTVKIGKSSSGGSWMPWSWGEGAGKDDKGGSSAVDGGF
jgi:receptor expression-enhancing protein 1/2/3/4